MLGLSLGLGLGSSRAGSGGGTPSTAIPLLTFNTTTSVASATNPEIGSSWQWRKQSDDTAISGATTTSFDLSLLAIGEGAYLVPDGQTARRSAALYHLPAIPAPTVTHYSPVGQTNGTNLVAFGWTALNKPSIMTVNSGIWSLTANYYNEGGWTKDVGSPDHAIKIVHAYANNLDYENLFDITVRRQDANNGINLSGYFTTGGGYNLTATVAGVTTTLTAGFTPHFPANVDGASIELVVRGNTAYIYENGSLRLSDSANPYATTDGGYNISSASSFASASTVAIGIVAGGEDLPLPFAKDIVTTSYAAAPISLTSATFTAPLKSSNYIKARLVGTAPVGVTTMSLGWYDSAGQPLYATTGLTVSSGAFDVSSVQMPHNLRGKAATLMFWKTSDPTVYGYSALPTTPAYQLVSPTLMGINTSTWGSISGDYLRDRAIGGEWRDSTNGGNINLGTTGWPTSTLAVGSLVTLGFWQSDINHRSGQFEISWPVGWTASAGTATNVTVDSINNTTRKALVTVLDQTSLTSFAMDFTPTGGAADCVVTCLPVGDAHPTYPVTDQFVSDYGISAGWRIVRFMKQMNTENPGYPKPRYFTPAYVAWQMKNMGIWPHLSFSVLDTEAYITGFLASLKTELTALGVDLTTIRIYVEWGNEVWNYGYQVQDHTAHWMAANEGFVPGVTLAEQGNVIYGFVPGVFTADRVFHAGDVVYYDGYKVCRVKRTTAIGAPFPASSADDNADFEFIATVSPTHRDKLQGAKQKRLAIITKPLFATGVVQSVLGIFENDLASEAWRRMSDDNIWKYVDVYESSGYISQLSNFGAKSFDADYATSATYLSGLMSYLTTDTGDGVPGTMSKLLNLKHGVEALIVASPDYTPGDTTPYFGTYEIGCHFGYNTNPPNEATLTSRLNEMAKATAWGTMWTTYGGRLVEEIGGPHVWFVDVEGHPVHYSDYFQNFGVRDNYIGANATDQKMWSALSTIALAQI